MGPSQPKFSLAPAPCCCGQGVSGCRPLWNHLCHTHYLCWGWVFVALEGALKLDFLVRELWANTAATRAAAESFQGVKKPSQACFGSSLRVMVSAETGVLLPRGHCISSKRGDDSCLDFSSEIMLWLCQVSREMDGFKQPSPEQKTLVLLWWSRGDQTLTCTHFLVLLTCLDSLHLGAPRKRVSLQHFSHNHLSNKLKIIT